MASKTAGTPSPSDDTHFSSTEEMLAFIVARAEGDNDPNLFQRIRNPRRAWAEDIMTRGRRLPGSGWSNLRRS